MAHRICISFEIEKFSYSSISTVELHYFSQLLIYTYHNMGEAGVSLTLAVYKVPQQREVSIVSLPAYSKPHRVL